jgi:hypothetical protein
VRRFVGRQRQAATPCAVAGKRMGRANESGGEWSPDNDECPGTGHGPASAQSRKMALSPNKEWMEGFVWTNGKPHYPGGEYEACVGCGHCCRSGQCSMSVATHGEVDGDCPSLFWQYGRYWCRIVLEHPEMSGNVGGTGKDGGCSSALFNDDRDRVIAEILRMNRNGLAWT